MTGNAVVASCLLARACVSLKAASSSKLERLSKEILVTSP